MVAPSTSVRDEVIFNLSQLQSLPLTAYRRAADMFMLHFGTLHSGEGVSVGEFALHIQCGWRIDTPTAVVTGRSDLWTPADENANYATFHHEKDANLQDARVAELFKRFKDKLIVRKIESDSRGSADISFDGGLTLRIFPVSSRGEYWRLFRPGKAPHFVVAAEGISVVGGDEDDTED